MRTLPLASYFPNLRDPMRWCAISVDLDEIPNYAAIHGVSLDRVHRHAVYDIAVRRLLDWARSRGVQLTWFAVAADLRREENAQQLREAREAGHEIANHSLDHYYDLSRRSRAEMYVQVKGAADLIAEKVGVRPVGFRAPGYTVSDNLYDTLLEAEVLYSSSVFPCPAYYGLKTAAIVLKRLRGRRSQSLVDDPRVLAAPTQPYWVGDPYWRRGDRLLELPIQTTPWLRLPFIGTSVTLAGSALARVMSRQLVDRPLINLELHGIDVLDATDGLEQLAPLQPDVRRSVSKKLAALDAVVETLRAAGYDFVALQRAADALRPA